MVFEGFDVLQDGHRLTKRGLGGRNEGRQAGRPVFKIATFLSVFTYLRRESVRNVII